ncbi:MAG: hypothetical protein ACOH2E_06585 [Candidatus Paracaedibacter sp.]
MKKNTFYALLCTTIMISSVSLAADKEAPKTPTSKFKQKQEDQAPLTPVRSIEQQIMAIPKTPSQEDQEKKYLSANSPYTSKYLAKRDVLEIKSDNAVQRGELVRKLEEEKYKKERAKLEEQQNERYNTLLEQQMKEKEAEEERNIEIEEMRLREETITKNLAQQKSEIEAMEKELAESKAATEKQRSQKMDIMVKADESQEKLTKKLQETEEKYKSLTVEHFQVKIKLDGLTFEKETKQKVKSEMNSKINGRQNNPSLEKKSAHATNNSPLVPSPLLQNSDGTQTTVAAESTIVRPSEEVDEFALPSGVNLSGLKK